MKRDVLKDGRVRYPFHGASQVAALSGDRPLTGTLSQRHDRIRALETGRLRL